MKMYSLENRHTSFAWICCLLIGLAVAALAPAAAQSTTEVQLIVPMLDVGEVGRVEAVIDCQVDLCSAFDVILSYDPERLRIDAFGAGGYLGDQVLEAENSIDPEAGTAHLAVTTLGNPDTSSSDILFWADVTALSRGSAQVSILQLQIGDLVGAPVDITWSTRAETDPGVELIFLVTGQLVNLRDEPGVDAGVVGTARRTEELQVIARVGSGYNTWYQVLLEDGEVAWIWANVGILSEDEEQLPIVEEAVLGAAPPTPAPVVMSTPVPGQQDAGTSDTNGGSGNSGGQPGQVVNVDPNDSDGDGTPNDSDDCPTVAGTSHFGQYGCPDSDNDGPPDHAEQCPNGWGHLYSNFCPPDPNVCYGRMPCDLDGDGLVEFDGIDPCPGDPQNLCAQPPPPTFEVTTSP